MRNTFSPSHNRIVSWSVVYKYLWNYRLSLIFQKSEWKFPRGGQIFSGFLGGSNVLKRFPRGGQMFWKAKFFDFLAKIEEKSIFFLRKLLNFAKFSPAAPLGSLQSRCAAYKGSLKKSWILEKDFLGGSNVLKRFPRGGSNFTHFLVK